MAIVILDHCFSWWFDFAVCCLQYDKYYVGELPPKQCTITNLNDNVRETFLRSMFEKFGTIEDINICFHPKTRKHLGLASVTFSTTRAAKQAVMELNRTSVMGKIIIVQIDAGGRTLPFSSIKLLFSP